MNTNIHPIERIFRIVTGLFLCSLVFWGPENYWFFLGAIPVLTGIWGWCPIYKILRIDTTEIDRRV